LGILANVSVEHSAQYLRIFSLELQYVLSFLQGKYGATIVYAKFLEIFLYIFKLDNERRKLLVLSYFINIFRPNVQMKRTYTYSIAFFDPIKSKRRIVQMPKILLKIYPDT